MGDFIPQTPSLGIGAGRAQWAQKPGGASGIARSDTCGATMRVPRFSPQTPTSLRAYRSFLSENSIKPREADAGKDVSPEGGAHVCPGRLKGTCSLSQTMRTKSSMYRVRYMPLR